MPNVKVQVRINGMRIIDIDYFVRKHGLLCSVFPKHTHKMIVKMVKLCINFVSLVFIKARPYVYILLKQQKCGRAHARAHQKKC